MFGHPYHQCACAGHGQKGSSYRKCQFRYKPRISCYRDLKDALDSLNHVCHIHARSETCLQENSIQGFCLQAATIRSSLQIDFHFICHQRRDENLVHSLQYLRDTRLLTMLFFHIASRCRGFSILDDVIRRYKNAYFYTLDLNPSYDRPKPPLLYCLSKSVVSTCIRDIVEDHCGTMTANFVQNYFVSAQNGFDQALLSAGLDSDICEHDTTSGMMPSRAPIPSDHAKVGLSRLLQITASGTALDTAWGKNVLLPNLDTLPGEKLCATSNVRSMYMACVMSSINKAERSKFNILQFAHQLSWISYHATRCSRLEQFKACWGLLQQMCGSKIKGMEQHATLMVEGCKIQPELDTAGCHWQDMLLGHYINASRVTVWPTTGQCLNNPMYLEDITYDSFTGIINDLDTLISLLQPGVEEISFKCGLKFSKRITSLLDKLRHLQRDAVQQSKENSSHLTDFFNSTYKSVCHKNASNISDVVY